MASVAFFVVWLTTAAPPTGLSALGPPGALQPAPQTIALETQLLTRINAMRQKEKKAPLQMQQPLRAFARTQARLIAAGETSAGDVNQRLRKLGFAPHGHRIHFAYGTDAERVLHQLVADHDARLTLAGDFIRVGVGAFLASPDPPTFQVVLLLAQDADPLAGKPGLSPQQTDPVMRDAMPHITACYDKARARDPNLAGQILTQMRIGGDGTVTSATLIKGLEAMHFDPCALEVLRGLRFPKPYQGKPVTLNHPIGLTPPQGTRRIGTLTPTQISGTFHQAQPDLLRCWEARAKGTRAGTLLVALTVTPEGLVNDLRLLRDEPGDPKLTQCIKKRVAGLRFPRPKHRGYVDVEFPLRFQPSGFTE